jgi:hypothetical protein
MLLVSNFVTTKGFHSMNLKYALATAGLMLLGAVSANALPISISITPSSGSAVTSFSGLLSNTGSTAIDIGADSIFDTNGSANVVSDSLADDIFNGLSIPGGGTHSFNFAFDAPVAPADVFVAVKDLNDNVVGTSVPEPGSVALLVGMTMSGGLFLARRRRK